LTIDNTAPVVSLTVQYDGATQSYDGTLNYNCQLSDAIDSTLTTQSFLVVHPSGDTPSSTTLTRSSDDNLQFTDTDYAGDYVFTCSATDAASNTATSTATVTVGELGRINRIDNTSSSGNSNKWIYIALGIVVLYFLFNKK